ncbi:MAG: PDGLE domain-containing protein [Patescibacteria group bacterium]
MKRITGYHVLAAALIIAGFVSLFASASPDGLEKVAEEQQFLMCSVTFLHGFMPDYSVPGIPFPHGAASLAGIIGTLLVCAVLAAIGTFLFRADHDRYRP